MDRNSFFISWQPSIWMYTFSLCCLPYSWLAIRMTEWVKYYIKECPNYDPGESRINNSVHIWPRSAFQFKFVRYHLRSWEWRVSTHADERNSFIGYLTTRLQPTRLLTCYSTEFLQSASGYTTHPTQIGSTLLLKVRAYSTLYASCWNPVVTLLSIFRRHACWVTSSQRNPEKQQKKRNRQRYPDKANYRTYF